ncbi:MAG: ABC transporter ATP-binding protein [Armatimonadetes bacterium]|nr:ABC transporter ATP-binding protein [Armatimonadota bacterium]
MIELVNASRWYGQVIGLNDVTCTIGPGITALLGMNGAGKTTLMRLVTGQIRPTTGMVTVGGHEPFANPEVFKIMGYCPEIDNFYETMTGREFVRFIGRLAGMSAPEANRKADEKIELVGMADRCDKKIRGYSKGMRQRIKLAQAMIHDPQIILLDEPLNGLDPVGRHEYLTLLHQLSEQGKAILVSSHILYEVEQMTKSLILLHRGRLLATGDLRVIRSLLDKYPHRVRIETEEPRRVASHLTALAYIVSVEFNRLGLEIQVRDPDAFYAEFGRLIIEQNLQITAFSSPDNNLESVFHYLVQT